MVLEDVVRGGHVCSPDVFGELKFGADSGVYTSCSKKKILDRFLKQLF